MPDTVNYFKGLVPDNKTVTTDSIEIIPENLKRKMVALINYGNKDVFWAAGFPAVVDKGLPIAKNGGILLLDQRLMTTNAINGITASGSSLVGFIEGVKANG